jgi:hypothetical protein
MMSGLVFIVFKCPYQAKVMNMFDMVKRTMVFNMASSKNIGLWPGAMCYFTPIKD